MNKEFTAKKSLGQNFLKSQSALSAIINESEIIEGDFILEIGPGKGALTEKILATNGKVIAIEKDEDLFEFLKEKFAEQIISGQLILINEDILKFDESTLSKNYKLIANIPYYITGQIIRKFLSTNNQPSKAVLLVQKEVAERMVSKPELMGSNKHPKTKESLLSLSVKIYCKPKFIKTVPAGSFVPSPKVDSAIVSLEKINKDIFALLAKKLNLKTEKVEEVFFEIIKSGFAHKRKTLLGNLKKSNFFKKNNIKIKQFEKLVQNFFKKNNLNLKIRAENLKLEDWVCLTENFLSAKFDII